MRHYRITIEDVISAHALALTYGGRPGILNEANLLSAIGRPYTGYYRSIYSKSAALLESMAGNHGFVDGNKRTALLVLTLFLKRSGYGLGDVDEALNDELEELIIKAAENKLDLNSCANWFKDRLVRLDN